MEIEIQVALVDMHLLFKGKGLYEMAVVAMVVESHTWRCKNGDKGEKMGERKEETECRIQWGRIKTECS